MAPGKATKTSIILPSRKRHSVDSHAELASISNTEAVHYTYYDLKSPKDFIDTLDQLEQYIAAEGPFEAVLAFSQGAGFAAMHIVRTALEGKPSPFQCAILICPNEVYDPVAWFDSHQILPLDPAVYGRPIRIPTVVIYGEKDPYKDRSERISMVCDLSKLVVYQHPGGHEVPGLGVKESVSQVVKMIRRGITQATLIISSGR